MKWLGQHIVDFIARFRSDVYLEDLTTTTDTSVLVVDANDKVCKNTTTLGGDITGVTLTSDSGSASDSSGNVDLTITGGNAIGTIASGSTVTVNHDDTSSQASSNNSGNTCIQDIAIDTYGHVTTIGTATIIDVETAVLAEGAVLAEVATEVTVAAQNTTDETVYPTFVDGATGTQGLETDTGLTYNPGTNVLTAVNFAGALNGNASGSSGSCTGAAATVTSIGNLTGDVTSVNRATTLASTQPNITSIGTDGDTLAILADDINISNSTASKPVINITNTHDLTTSGELRFNKDSTGDDDDIMGLISFYGTDSSDNALERLAYIDAIITDSAHGSEASSLQFYVAENDATLTRGLLISGQADDDGEVDVTIGAGAASVVTIPGNIDLAGDIDVDGTLETDALTLTGGTAVTSIDADISSVSGSDDTLATAKAIKTYVDGKFTYVYMQTNGRSSGNNTNWNFMDSSGDGNFNWEDDTGAAWDGGSSGIDNDGTNTTANVSTLVIGRDVGVMGMVVPYDCTLVGFKCIGRDLSGNDAFKAGLWSSPAYSAYGGLAGDSTFTLRAVATASYAGGGGSNYNGICKLDDLTSTYSLTAGDILLPSMSETDTSRHFISMTIVLKVPII